MKTVKKEIQELKQILQTVTSETFEKARKYEEMKSLLKLVTMKVDKIRVSIDKERTEYGVTVEYKIEPIKLLFGSDGEIMQNDRFRAMNLLDLISVDDMLKISKCIQDAANKNKEEIK